MRPGGSFGEGLGPTASAVRDALAGLTLETCCRYHGVIGGGRRP
jgi:hypothetical protein